MTVEVQQVTRDGYLAYVLPLAALVLALALVGALWPTGSGDSPEIVQVEQLTHDRLEKYGPLLTDGSRIYFCEDAPQGCSLSYVSVEGGDTASVPSPFPSIVPYDLSARGSQFLIGNGPFGKRDLPLWIVPVAGGSPERVGRIFTSGAAWSADGTRIAYASGTSLYTASPDGSGIHRLASFPRGPQHIHWSPDERRLRFDMYSGNPPHPAAWEIEANGFGLHRVLPGWAEGGDGFFGDWTPDGQHYVFSILKRAGAGDVGTLWATSGKPGPLAFFGRDNSVPVRLGDESRGYYAPVPSRDGRKLFVIGEERSGELVRYEGRDAEFVPYLNRLDGRWVTFSPDGRWVAYSRYSDGTVWCMHPDGSGMMQLTYGPTYSDGLAWSPDSHWIAFHAQATPGAHFKIYLLPAPGPGHGNEGDKAAAPAEPKEPRELLPADNQNEGIPTWSPDSRRIAFGEMDGPTSSQGSGNEMIHTYNLGSHQRSFLQGKKGVWTARWSPNGRYIAALTYDQRQRLELYDFKKRRWRDLDAEHIDNPTWSHDSKYIYYDTEDAIPSLGILRVRIGDGKVELAAPFRGMRVADHTWSGLAPDDSPIVLRDVGIQEIYALNVKWK